MNDGDDFALRALANIDRIRIIAKLADRALTTAELANGLYLDTDTLTTHLTALGTAGLITTRKERHERRMTVNTDRLRELESTAANRTSCTTQDESIPLSVRQFFGDGKLKSLPAKRALYRDVLEFLVADFDLDTDYPEAQVNTILLERHEDFATLRRDLVDFAYMTRSAGIYRRTK